MADVDLLEVAKKLDPRFAENMPEEVAKAFSEGRVTHVFRTSEALSNIQENINAGEEIIPTGGLNMADQQAGSIYVRTQEGATARWKLPELAMGDDAGWNANRGYGIFADVGAEPVLGQKAYEEINLPNGGKITHPGHNVADVYDASGNRSYLQFDPKTNTMHSLSDKVVSSGSATQAMPTATVSPGVVPEPIPAPTVSPGVSNLGESATGRVRTGPRHAAPNPSRPVIPVGQEVNTATTAANNAGVSAAATSGVKQVDHAVAKSVASAETKMAGGIGHAVGKDMSQAVLKGSKSLRTAGLGALLAIGTFSFYKSQKNKSSNVSSGQRPAYVQDSAADIKSLKY